MAFVNHTLQYDVCYHIPHIITYFHSSTSITFWHHDLPSLQHVFTIIFHPLLNQQSSLKTPHPPLYTLHTLSITGTLTYPKDGSEKGPVIVFVHGTMSFKDHNFVPDVCKKMIADYGENVMWSFFCDVHELWFVVYYLFCFLHSSLFLILSFSFSMIYHLFIVLWSLFSTTITPFEWWI